MCSHGHGSLLAIPQQSSSIKTRTPHKLLHHSKFQVFFSWCVSKIASKAVESTALLLCLNLLFFTFVSSTNMVCPPPPKSPSHHHHHHHHHHRKATCPKDTLKLGVCTNLLNDLVHLVVGNPAKTPCCSLLEGLADLEAAVCLCTAIKANVLGNNLNVSVSLSLLLNYCGKNVPTGFQCA